MAVGRNIRLVASFNQGTASLQPYQCIPAGFLGKTYLKHEISRSHMISYQSLLSTTVLNDIRCMYFCDSNINITYAHTSSHMYMCMWFKVVLFCIPYTAPPAITAVEVNEICTNEYTVSWTPASNKEGLSYNVIVLLQSDVIFSDSTMDTSYNFTGLTPNTDYSVSIISVLNSCSGTPNTIIVTTVTVDAGVPQSKLIVTVMDCTYECTYVRILYVVVMYLYA